MRQGAIGLFIFGLMLANGWHTLGQERVGIANSNYAGTLGVPLNPSMLVDSKTYLDVNIIGLDAFVWNNYVFLSHQDFYFWNNVPNPENFPDLRDNMNGTIKHGAINLRIDGPSATLNLGRHAFGIHTAGRVFASIEDIPQPAAKHIYDGLDYFPQRRIIYDLRNFGAYATAWAEVGLTYSTIAYAYRRNLITAGITAKYLMGLAHTSIKIDRIQYEVVDSMDWRIDNFTGEYALADPGIAGHGWGFDVGITYKRLAEGVATDYKPFDPRYKCKQVAYKYKVGLSVIDIGQINFNQGSLYRRFDNATSYWVDYNTFDFNGVRSLDASIGNRFTGNQSSEQTYDNFTAWLPSAVSLQFDYAIRKNLYANLTYVQGFKLSEHQTGIRRSLISITPRYELKHWGEVSLPVSLYDYQFPQVGLAFRFYSLVIGSDNILPMFIPMDVYGANIYFNLKVSIFKNPKCSPKRKKHKTKKGLKSNHPDDCPAY